MTALNQLAASLARINSETLARFVTTAPSPMEAVAARLQDQSADVRRRSQTADFGLRLLTALATFRNGPKTEIDFRSLRLLCHGCCQHIEADRYVLIGDGAARRALFGHVAGYAGDRRAFRRLYDGLMRAYFGVDRTADWFDAPNVHEGTGDLRAFLDGTFDGIAELEPRPDWVQAVDANRHILSTDPGDQFAHAWLKGETHEFQALAQRLGLTGSAWLVSETVRSALHAAVRLPDLQFMPHLIPFLAAAKEQRFRFLSNEIYSGLLNRYAQLAHPMVHPHLRDAVVAAWKNPWLALNASAWGGVTPEAKQMVTSWLKLELIHQFFEVLSEDGRQDKRRFEFWRGYHDRMDDVFFALGSRAYHSTHPDAVKLKSALEGRLFELTGTEADTNAFIMCMADTVVVEFSKHGNAAYRYDRDQLPLDVSRRSIRIDELKRGQTRLLHMPSQGLTWEERFAQALGGGVQQTKPSKLQPVTAPAVKAADITAFASARSIGIEDHRAKGGSLWLFTDEADSQVVVQLTAWGFKFRPGKGWWRSQ